VDEHMIRVLATDGNPVQEMVVDYLIIAAGERYDFTLDTTTAPPLALGNYYMRLEGMGVSAFLAIT
jgi:FtsP/CotA-like multicopper oxidase with cupredoxin domain